MKILDKLNIKTTGAFICSLASLYNVGKSTILSIIAADLVNEGKSIIFITEDNPKYMLRKLKNLIKTENTNFVVIQNLDNNKHISELIGERKFDYVMLDTPTLIDEDKLHQLQVLSFKQNIGIFLSHQLAYSLYTGKYKLNDIKPSKVIAISDYVIIITRKGVDTLFKKILRKISIKMPNISLNLFKNRTGSLNSANIYVDFEKINKQTI